MGTTVEQETLEILNMELDSGGTVRNNQASVMARVGAISVIETNHELEHAAMGVLGALRSDPRNVVEGGWISRRS